MANLSLVVKQLQQERNRLSSQLEALGRSISALNGVSSNGARRTTAISAAGKWCGADLQVQLLVELLEANIYGVILRLQINLPQAARRLVAAHQVV